MNNIKVERETYNKNDKKYFAYFVKGNIRGRDVKLSIMPYWLHCNPYSAVFLLLPARMTPATCYRKSSATDLPGLLPYYCFFIFLIRFLLQAR